MNTLAQPIAPPRKVWQFSQRKILAASGLLAIIAIASALLGNEYIAIAAGIPGYLVLPGFLAQLAVRRKATFDLNSFIYTVGLSLFFWLMGGLAINSLLPLMGLNRPLQLAFILPLYALGVTALGTIAYLRNPHVTHDVQRIRFNGMTKFATGLALLFPVMSVLGSTTLNNGGNGLITIAMLIMMCAYVVFLATGIQRIHRNVYPVAIFGISLALLLMYSMRSWHVLGWDIHNEVRVLNATMAMSQWKMSTYPTNAYNACLSITILPTILARLFHMSGEYVFKFLYQVIFAIVPVAIYATARRFLMPALALLASILFTAQTWFFELMPALARQEIALMYFALFLLAITDQAIQARYRRLLLYVFAAGIVLSHYSSAYVWLILCALAYIMLWIVRLFSKSARLAPRGLTWPLVLFGAALIFLWEGPVTNSAGPVGTTINKLGPQLAQTFSPGVIEDAIKDAILGPTIANGTSLAGAYSSAVSSRPGTAAQYYSPAVAGAYKPIAVTTTSDARNYLPAAVSSAVHLFGTVVKAVVSNLMTALGVLLLALYFVRRNHKSNLDFIAFCAAGYTLIVLILMVPYLQVVYNLTRLGLQIFIMLVIPATAALWVAFRRSVRFGLPAIALITALMLAYQSGLLDQFTGGLKRLTLDQPPATFDTYYVHASEVYSAQWLARNRLPHIPVYADSVADLRLESYANIEADNESIFPETIPINSYVYLSYDNVVLGAASVEVNSNTVSYNTPTKFLSQNKDLIYSSGTSEIYR
ncbi:MAG TPA: DUF2206 domain-containing protein [Candidatus Saccharimonadia bacterium]|nr:DUF2206 domain-containing protein [Candidatus Saccharimonadia bacterium]